MNGNLILSNGENLFCNLDISVDRRNQPLLYKGVVRGYPNGIETISITITFNSQSNYGNFSHHNMYNKKLSGQLHNSRLGGEVLTLEGLFMSNIELDMNGDVTMTGTADHFIMNDMTDEQMKRKLRLSKLKRILENESN